MTTHHQAISTERGLAVVATVNECSTAWQVRPAVADPMFALPALRIDRAQCGTYSYGYGAGPAADRHWKIVSATTFADIFRQAAEHLDSRIRDMLEMEPDMRTALHAMDIAERALRDAWDNQDEAQRDCAAMRKAADAIVDDASDAFEIASSYAAELEDRYYNG